MSTVEDCVSNETGSLFKSNIIFASSEGLLGAVKDERISNQVYRQSKKGRMERQLTK